MNCRSGQTNQGANPVPLAAQNDTHPTRHIALLKALEFHSILANFRYCHFSISLICRCREQIRSNAQALQMSDFCQCDAHEAFANCNSIKFVTKLPPPLRRCRGASRVHLPLRKLCGPACEMVCPLLDGSTAVQSQHKPELALRLHLRYYNTTYNEKWFPR